MKETKQDLPVSEILREEAPALPPFLSEHTAKVVLLLRPAPLPLIAGKGRAGPNNQRRLGISNGFGDPKRTGDIEEARARLSINRDGAETLERGEEFENPRSLLQTGGKVHRKKNMPAGLTGGWGIKWAWKARPFPGMPPPRLICAADRGGRINIIWSVRFGSHHEG